MTKTGRRTFLGHSVGVAAAVARCVAAVNENEAVIGSQDSEFTDGMYDPGRVRATDRLFAAVGGVTHSQAPWEGRRSCTGSETDRVGTQRHET